MEPRPRDLIGAAFLALFLLVLVVLLVVAGMPS